MHQIVQIVAEAWAIRLRSGPIFRSLVAYEIPQVVNILRKRGLCYCYIVRTLHSKLEPAVSEPVSVVNASEGEDDGSGLQGDVDAEEPGSAAVGWGAKGRGGGS